MIFHKLNFMNLKDLKNYFLRLISNGIYKKILITKGLITRIYNKKLQKMMSFSTFSGKINLIG